MIKIIDDWYVTVETNPTNYIVRCGKGKKDKKNGWKDRPIAFFGSLRKAVNFIRDQIITESFLNSSIDLPEAIRTIENIDARFAEILDKIEA